MRALGQAGVVDDAAVRRRVLDEDAEQVLPLDVGGIGGTDVHLDAQGLRARPHHGDRLRMAVLGHQEPAASTVAREVVAHSHGFRGRGGLVEQRGVGEGQRGEVRHHGLEVQEGFQPALRDLRLIGCVLGVPARVLQDVALDDGRRDAVVVPHADEGAEDLVARGHLVQVVQQLVLTARLGQTQLAVEADPLRHGGGDELLERRVAEGTQHLLHLGLVRADVAAREGVGGSQGLGGGGGNGSGDHRRITLPRSPRTSGRRRRP